MDIVAMSGQEAFDSVKGVADLDVIENLPDVKEEDDNWADIDDGGTVTDKVLNDNQVVDLYV